MSSITFIRVRRLFIAATLASVASCRNPAADANIIEQMRQVGDELNAARQEAATMHEQIDSLRVIVARQDTLLRQLAGMANVPVPPR
jgi:translation initiation factor 2B subunit (eIF-2B alpha/beta/delta family)